MNPTFSIIIPCLNEEAFIEDCLESINSQNLQRCRFEIIVVDNGSTDQSVEKAQKLADKIILAPGVFVGAVRNVGAYHARGEVLVFIDADCTLDYDWLTRAEKLLLENPDSVLGGGAALPEDAAWIERFWLLEGPKGNQLPKELIGCSIVVPSAIFSEITGFDEKFSSGEDTDFSKRAKKLKYSVMITRDLNVKHLGNAKNIKSFIKRQAWHAKSYHKSFKSNIKDPIFLLIITFVTLAISGILIFTLLNAICGTLIVFLAFLLPTILTIKRYIRANRSPKTPSEVAISYFLDLLYVIGRVVGLIYFKK
ncbi:family 2 glycosyl transferase [Marinobacter santoriniensis NKSG1]|uniref:Family 2 glycosyl transferase n=1 Tax=Marinobacter santoriniensis NKSG1 TaxID=1288826 RepID=M7CPI7_9GAMM|nr:glycosyltransferase [Marinobacter santoriniensis]EMP55571.1 family 2 glycosyl transferase [Marinobacter santoriniensis NKSG1]